VKLLLDEQTSGRVAERLRDRGHDVTAATDDLTLRGLRDPDLFEVAQEQGRALVAKLGGRSADRGH
jgi:predicted nuclease of predicted toxin-antitoxin system